MAQYSGHDMNTGHFLITNSKLKYNLRYTHEPTMIVGIVINFAVKFEKN